VIVTVEEALRAVPQSFRDASLALGATKSETIFRVVLSHAAPGVLTMELGYHIFVLSTQSPDVEATKPLLYATVFVLLALTFLVNIVAILIRTRLRIAAGGSR
jgi:phosphate transport system permease protein